VRALLEEARTALAIGTAPAAGAGSRLPELRPEVRPARLREGKPAQIAVAWPGGDARQVRLFHRARGEAHYTTVSAPPGLSGLFELEVPGSAVRAPALEYYLTALDDQGASVARAGTFAEPLVAEVVGEIHPRRRRWAWGVAVGVIAAAAVGLGVGLGLGLPDAHAPAHVTLISPR
jgi:hypothetical protein